MTSSADLSEIAKAMKDLFTQLRQASIELKDLGTQISQTKHFIRMEQAKDQVCANVDKYIETGPLGPSIPKLNKLKAELQTRVFHSDTSCYIELSLELKQLEDRYTSTNSEIFDIQQQIINYRIWCSITVD